MQGNVTEVIGFLKGYVPEVARKKHIEIARKGLARVIAKNPGIPYRILVDGRAAYSEDQVKPFGVIKYVFIRLGEIAKYASLTAQEFSPVESGRYKKSWILIVDGQPFFSFLNIPPNAEQIILTNFQPYARKIQVRGARLRGVPPGIVEKVRQKVLSKYRSQVRIDLQFIELRGAYVLKNNYIQKRRSGRLRLHTRAGKEITYPSLIITPRE